jgi:hypothetical protein
MSGSSAKPVSWWFNVKTKQVERMDEGAPNAYRLGPFDTPEDAALALEKAAARTEVWDKMDEQEEP